MDRNIIEARIGRSAITEHAGDHLVIDVDLIEDRSGTRDALFMLYLDDSCWTLLTEKSLIYKCEGSEGKLPVHIAGDQMHDFSFDRAKGQEFSGYVDLSDRVRLWVVNERTFYSLQNVLLLFEK